MSYVKTGGFSSVRSVVSFDRSAKRTKTSHLKKKRNETTTITIINYSTVKSDSPKREKKNFHFVRDSYARTRAAHTGREGGKSCHDSFLTSIFNCSCIQGRAGEGRGLRKRERVATAIEMNPPGK